MFGVLMVMCALVVSGGGRWRRVPSSNCKGTAFTTPTEEGINVCEGALLLALVDVIESDDILLAWIFIWSLSVLVGACELSGTLSISQQQSIRYLRRGTDDGNA